MTLGFKYVLGLGFAIVVMIFGFIFPNAPIKEVVVEKSELDSLLLTARVNMIAYQKINNSIDSVGALTDSLNEDINQDLGKINNVLGYKDNFLVTEKDSIIFYIKQK